MAERELRSRCGALPWQRCRSRSQPACLPLFERDKIKDGSNERVK